MFWAIIAVAASLTSIGCDDTPGTIADVGVADVGVADVGVADVGADVAPTCGAGPTPNDVFVKGCEQLPAAEVDICVMRLSNSAVRRSRSL
jgi:hypothetical protein